MQLAQTIADLNPLMSVAHLASQAREGTNAYGKKMSGMDIASKAADLVPFGAAANAGRKGLLMLGKGVGRLAKTSTNAIKIAEGGIPRIQNAANRIGKPIHLVGSRANGTARATSDFDYVIKGINSKQWTKIKNSLPGAPSRVDNLPRRIDLFRGPLDPTKPHITVYPH